MIYISWFSTVFPDILNHCWTPVLTQTNIEWKEENPINANRAHWIVSDLSLCCVGRVQSTCIIHVYTSFLHVHRRIVQKVVFFYRTHIQHSTEHSVSTKKDRCWCCPMCCCFERLIIYAYYGVGGWVSVYRDFTRCRLNTWKWYFLENCNLHISHTFSSFRDVSKRQAFSWSTDNVNFTKVARNISVLIWQTLQTFL